VDRCVDDGKTSGAWGLRSSTVQGGGKRRFAMSNLDQERLAEGRRCPWGKRRGAEVNRAILCYFCDKPDKICRRSWITEPA